MFLRVLILYTASPATKPAPTQLVEKQKLSVLFSHTHTNAQTHSVFVSNTEHLVLGRAAYVLILIDSPVTYTALLIVTPSNTHTHPPFFAPRKIPLHPPILPNAGH